MRYIVHRRLRATGLSGPLNLPFGTVCESNGETILLNGKAIMLRGSELAHQYLARDDDGNGIERGKLTQAIQQTLRRKPRATEKQLAERKRLWGIVLQNEPKFRHFRMREHADFWCWSDDFFNADIAELREFAGLIGAKGGENV